METISILWLRQSLRLQDNLALCEAIKAGKPILPLYIFHEDSGNPWPIGRASRWWLHSALEDLDAQFRKYGTALHYFNEPAGVIFEKLAHQYNIAGVFSSMAFEPHLRKIGEALKAQLALIGVPFYCVQDNLIHDPITLKNKAAGVFKVFTPFWKECLKRGERRTVCSDLACMRPPKQAPKGAVSLSALALLSGKNWEKKLTRSWDPTALGAQNALKLFVKEGAQAYANNRDIPSAHNTSRLSPYLHFGQLSPHQIIEALPKNLNNSVYLSELGWREFAYYSLYHHPRTPECPLDPKFADFPWKENKAFFEAWCSGKTGFPLVDAGMRELYDTGWMHNRVRMVVASFLVKHLLIPWQTGARYFWDCLVDADLANNTLGWQWTAGCGADAAPYFRIFNPVLQSKRFDSEGIYIKRFVPELRNVPAKAIHEPWKYSTQFPEPIVSHAKGRFRALLAYSALNKRF